MKWQEVMGTNENAGNSTGTEEKISYFSSENDQVMAGVFQRLLLGDLQKLSGCGPGHPALGGQEDLQRCFLI